MGHSREPALSMILARWTSLSIVIAKMKVKPMITRTRIPAVTSEMSLYTNITEATESMIN